MHVWRSAAARPTEAGHHCRRPSGRRTRRSCRTRGEGNRRAFRVDGPREPPPIGRGARTRARRRDDGELAGCLGTQTTDIRGRCSPRTLRHRAPVCHASGRRSRMLTDERAATSRTRPTPGAQKCTTEWKNIVGRDVAPLAQQVFTGGVTATSPPLTLSVTGQLQTGDARPTSSRTSGRIPSDGDRDLTSRASRSRRRDAPRRRPRSVPSSLRAPSPGLGAIR
jgi:hypothetical protein